MMAKFLMFLKTILVTVVAGAVVIASFYTAYLILTLVVLAIVGGVAYLYFNWGNVVDWYELDD